MSVPAAFLGVIVIWSTTPLAIQWSSEGWGYLFGATGRMVLGVLVCVALISVLRHKLPMDRKAWETYIAAGAGIYGAMMSVYWGSQYIPSGLVAVIFGLTPVATAVLAVFVDKGSQHFILARGEAHELPLICLDFRSQALHDADSFKAISLPAPRAQ